MALIKSSLSSSLEDVLRRKLAAEEAAIGWATAYVDYAGGAMSSASSLATNAQGNLSILQGAFSGAFQSRSSGGAAAAISAGVIAFWAAIVWSGPTASGATLSPGNFALSGALSSIFSDTGEMSESEKASALADAFDTGAKLVMVSDIPFAQPAPPIVGPMS